MGDAGGEEGQMGKPVEPAQELAMPPRGVGWGGVVWCSLCGDPKEKPAEQAGWLC